MTGERSRRTELVGLISDTHGLVRPEALKALSGCSTILHAGDIGGEHVLEALRAIAPVVAVRGNNDRDPAAERIPGRRRLTIGGRRVFLVHDVRDVPAKIDAFDLVVFGHSHVPKIERRGEVLFVNPGSAGPRRFRLPVCLALARIGAAGIEARIVNVLGAVSSNAAEAL